MRNKLVSVVIPAYNAARTIARCLDSIFGQTYHDIEVIVIDDGSTDDTIEICHTYQEKDERIGVYRFENHGPGYARNKGMELSRGEFIIFIDSDDWCDAKMVEKLVKHADEADLVICGINIINAATTTAYLQAYGNGRYLVGDYINLLQGKLNPFFGGPVNKLFRREKIESNQISYSEENTYGEDFCFNVDYLCTCDSVYIVAEGLYNYIVNQEVSLTIKNYNQMDYKKFWCEEMFLYRKYKSLIKNNSSCCGDMLLLGLWKVFISKLNKNMNMTRRDRIKVLFKFLEQTEVKKELYEIKPERLRDKIRIQIYTNRAALTLICMLLDVKHRVKQKMR